MINNKIMKTRTLSPRQIRLFERLIPLARLESIAEFKKGLLHCFVAEKEP